MELVFKFLIITLSVGSLPLLGRWMWKWSRDGSLDANARFIIYIWALNVLSWVAGRFLGGAYVEYGQYGESYSVAQGWVDIVDKWSIPATIALGLIRLIAVQREQGRFTVGVPGITAMLVVVGGAVGALASAAAQTSFRQVLLLVLLLVATVTVKGGRALYGAAISVWLLAIVSGLLLLVNPAQATRPCRFDKCGPMGDLYRGIFGNENALGIALAIGLPFLVVALVGRKMSWLPLGLVVVSTYATGSRTSQIGLLAGVVGCVLWYVFHFGRSRSFIARFSKIVLILLVPILLFAQAWITFSAGSGDYTNRAELWSWGLEEVWRSWFFGVGWNALELYFASTGGIAGASSYSLHNQLLDVFVIGGVAGVVAFLSLIWILVRRAVRGDMSSILIMIPMLAIGMLETPWSFGQSDWLTWALVAAVMSSSGLDKVRQPAVESVEDLNGRIARRPAGNRGTLLRARALPAPWPNAVRVDSDPRAKGMPPSGRRRS